jgi:hypothetical protein
MQKKKLREVGIWAEILSRNYPNARVLTTRLQHSMLFLFLLLAEILNFSFLAPNLGI